MVEKRFIIPWNFVVRNAKRSYKFDFNHPTATAVNMYGIAKKNGGWHGAKLIVK